jgi:hypothetical protein
MRTLFGPRTTAIVLAVLLAACGGTSTGSTPSAAAPGAVLPPPPQCDASLWEHVYDPGRLKIMGACQTVTGTITDQHTNDDGDIDVRIAVDPAYANLLNAGNISGLNGHLQTEAICQTAVKSAEAAPACRGFTGSIVIPRDGTRVQVTGTYVLDTHHGWMEIHPISDLRVIQ